MNVQQIRIPRISKGTMFNVSPHFMAPKKRDLPEKPGFYIREIETGDRYIGYLNNLNERNISLREYQLIVRGIGNGGDSLGNGPLILEERLGEGNKIHFEIERQINGGRFFGRFLNYGIFINGSNSVKGEDLLKGVYIFGRVDRITGEHRFI